MKVKRSICLVMSIIMVFLMFPVSASADSYREFEYDVSTPWSEDDVQEMLDYACQWVGEIDYASSQNNTDPDGERFEELHYGGATDCSWFVYHVLFAYNIGSDVDDAVPGDIICTGEGTKPQNSHVMIYIGNGEVVECAAGHGVIISDAPGWARDIVHFECIPTGRYNKAVDTE